MSEKISIEALLAMKLEGRRFYSHSPGEGYHYRGRVASVERTDDALSMKVCDVETLPQGEIDIDKYCFSPSSIPGPWNPYEDFEYASDRISASQHTEGIRISFMYAGVVYIPK